MQTRRERNGDGQARSAEPASDEGFWFGMFFLAVFGLVIVAAVAAFGGAR